MKYDKCPRCELNYKPIGDEYCSVCLRQIKGLDKDADDVEFDVCPFCEKRRLAYGEELCSQCALKAGLQAEFTSAERESGV